MSTTADDRIRDRVYELALNGPVRRRLPWWQRRGEKELFLTHSNPPALGEQVTAHWEDGNPVYRVTSVLPEGRTATIYGVGVPCHRVMGKLVQS